MNNLPYKNFKLQEKTNVLVDSKRFHIYSLKLIYFWTFNIKFVETNKFKVALKCSIKYLRCKLKQFTNLKSFYLFPRR